MLGSQHQSNFNVVLTCVYEVIHLTKIITLISEVGIVTPHPHISASQQRDIMCKDSINGQCSKGFRS